MPPLIQRIIFWQNVLSIHQSAFVRALAVRPGMQVWFAYEKDLSDSRKAMGWTVPDYGSAKLIDSRDPANWEGLVAMNDDSTCHVFYGYFVLPRSYAAFRRLRHLPCRRIWISEAFDFHGWRGWLRLGRARWHVLREARNGFDRVLGMGNLGTKFFQRTGIRPEQTREFGYLVEPPAVDRRELESPPGSECRFIFVGQLVRRKGVDLLIRAMARLPQTCWTLDLIGDGCERKALTKQAASYGLSSQIRFWGNQTNVAALKAIRAADALVLPSRWDGWGAVVNEALMLGTPAIVSDSCGAASLIVDERCGWVFQRADIKGLAQALQSAFQQRIIRQQHRKKLQQWASESCGAAPLATYFLNCLSSLDSSLAQVPPWRCLALE